ncbi:MAG: redoxin domain-containing protein [Abitibacteriaceae bacterium]|nr:redoxin domain-containing protein [Abditibacteriaceae bacterium]MBV9865065.1 redoxin domain-containing protein [Abditibacteriaceae bacterium]
MKMWRVGSLVVTAFVSFAVAVRADEGADALLKDVATATNAVQTLTANLTLSKQSGDKTPRNSYGTIRLMKPNYAFIQLGAPIRQNIASDGKTLWTLMTTRDEYLKSPVDANGSNITAKWAFPVQLFFNPDVMAVGGTRYKKTTTLSADETIRGESYNVVTVNVTDSEKKEPDQRLKLYIGTDKLIHRTVLEENKNDRVYRWSAVLNEMQVGATLTPATFAFHLPEDAELYKADPYLKYLLKVGKTVPDFALPIPNGGQVSLSQMLQGKKAVLVNFWFAGCPHCRQEFPHLQQLYREYKDQGLALITVNRGDSSDIINQFLQLRHLDFPVAMAAKGPESIFQGYGVYAYPSNFLIDSRGKVLFRSAGFDEEKVRDALEDIGL